MKQHTEKDSIWGDGGDGTGKNLLGQVLMQVRDILQSESKNRGNQFENAITICLLTMIYPPCLPQSHGCFLYSKYIYIFIIILQNQIQRKSSQKDNRKKTALICLNQSPR